MQKHIAMNIIRDHQSLMIVEAKKLDAEVARLTADKARLWEEIRRLTPTIEKLDVLPNIHVQEERAKVIPTGRTEL